VRGRKAKLSVRTIDIPVPPTVETAERMLASRLGPKAAEAAILRVSEELGLVSRPPGSVLCALALARLGADLEKVSAALDWGDFERFCAMVISAFGFEVKKNVRLRKPTRQIDLVAESSSLVLVIDCKHWRRRAGAGSFAPVADAQIERTQMLARASGAPDKAFLPMVLTMVDPSVALVGGVPVVPLQCLKDFLSTVNPYDESLFVLRA